ncbi:MAG: 4Fe-4S ferredoxin [Planctomycetes bacterium]|nr:4Fe-4S ferredoxin [Planctomycetota bacterium]
MIRRKIVHIDEEKCDGCGQCVDACAEGAIQIVDGKARLVSDTYCDGLGDCLGECPQGAITVEEREAEPFDEEAAKEHVQRLTQKESKLPCGCPGSSVKEIVRPTPPDAQTPCEMVSSELTNWPVQLTLVPPDAPYFKGADLLVVADCVPFAFAGFHERFLRGKPVVVGCPKLDDPESHAEKLTEILKCSSIKTLTVVHMEVPCCSGLTRIAEAALEASGGGIPFHDVTIGIRGEVLKEELVGEEA